MGVGGGGSGTVGLGVEVLVSMALVVAVGVVVAEALDLGVGSFGVGGGGSGTVGCGEDVLVTVAVAVEVAVAVSVAVLVAVWLASDDSSAEYTANSAGPAAKNVPRNTGTKTDRWNTLMREAFLLRAGYLVACRASTTTVIRPVCIRPKVEEIAQANAAPG